MALHVYCDWCGDLITGTHVPSDLGQLDARLQYHTHCAEDAVAVLQDRAKWAREGEASGLEWRLVPARKPEAWADRRGASQEDRDELIRGRDRRESAGTPLCKLGLDQQTHSTLYWGADIVTVEELTELSDDQLLAIPQIGAKRLREIKDALGEAA